MNIITRAIRAWQNWRDRKRAEADELRLQRMYPQYRQYLAERDAEKRGHKRTKHTISKIIKAKTAMLRGEYAQGIQQGNETRSTSKVRP